MILVEMDGTWNNVKRVFGDELTLQAEAFVRRGEGYYFQGQRPGRGWHRHGTFTRGLWLIRDGHLVHVVLEKQRWFAPETGRSCHSRSPLESLSSGFSLSVLFIWLWAQSEQPELLQGGEGFIAGPLDKPSPRSLQRWLRLALTHSIAIQQALRRIVIEKYEPRLVEQIFEESGVPPPSRVQQKQRRAPEKLALRWGLAFLISGAIALRESPSSLLAEARRRTRETPFPI